MPHLFMRKSAYRLNLDRENHERDQKHTTMPEKDRGRLGPRASPMASSDLTPETMALVLNQF